MVMLLKSLAWVGVVLSLFFAYCMSRVLYEPWPDNMDMWPLFWRDLGAFWFIVFMLDCARSHYLELCGLRREEWITKQQSNVMQTTKR